MLHSFRQIGMWGGARGENLLDTGAPFYEVYETLDHKFVAIGALEAPFYEELLARLQLSKDPRFTAQMDKSQWPAMRAAFSALFATETREHWVTVFEGSDACFAPVLSPAEAPSHPHNRERQTFEEAHGALHPAPAPRFSRTPSAIQGPPALPGAHTMHALSDWGSRTRSWRAPGRAGHRLAARAHGSMRTAVASATLRLSVTHSSLLTTSSDTNAPDCASPLFTVTSARRR